jgi:hypothetical protein
MWLAGDIQEMTVPEEKPEWFDPSWTDSRHYGETYLPNALHRSAEEQNVMLVKFKGLLRDLKEGRLSQDSMEPGPAPPGTVFTNFDEAMRRNGRRAAERSQWKKVV